MERSRFMDKEQIKERITRYKCTFCGDRRKKLVKLTDAQNIIIGYSAICCNCGHVEHFALTYESIPIYAAGLKEGRVKNVSIACGTNIDDVTRYCEAKNCPCRPQIPPEKPSYSSSDRDWFPQLKPVLEKYEGYNHGDKEGIYRGEETKGGNL